MTDDSSLFPSLFRNTAYQELGKFISSLEDKQISTDFLKYYTSIPHLSSAEADADCTNHCAFNFPSVTLIIGKNRWIELNDCYNTLCRKTFKSRKIIPIDCSELIWGFGAIHCMTQQEPSLLT